MSTVIRCMIKLVAHYAGTFAKTHRLLTLAPSGEWFHILILFFTRWQIDYL